MHDFSFLSSFCKSSCRVSVAALIYCHCKVKLQSCWGSFSKAALCLYIIAIDSVDVELVFSRTIYHVAFSPLPLQHTVHPPKLPTLSWQYCSQCSSLLSKDWRNHAMISECGGWKHVTDSQEEEVEKHQLLFFCCMNSVFSQCVMKQLLLAV